MTSSSPPQPRHPGAHAKGSDIAPEPPAAYEPYLDGLFTYCLSVLCDHDEAVEALGDVLALAERRRRRGLDAGPATDAVGLRPWLYSLARWACLRRMSRRDRFRTGGAAKDGAPPSADAPDAADGPAARRRELARLAWPEAAGTTPEQREALELAVRHGLPPDEVAVVLAIDPYAARELLSRAACEVERTQAALAVVEHGSCPVVAGLAGDSEVLLGAALRRELVRHVDDCPDCRRTAERACAAAGWPGSLSWVSAKGGSGRLPVLAAPRPAAHSAMARALGVRRMSAPRYDRTGFPQDPKVRAARRDRLRNRAITSTVVATVVAAPVLALWAAYRGAPTADDGRDAFPAATGKAMGPRDLDGDPVEEAGSAQELPAPRYTAGSRTPDVSVEVVDSGGPTDRARTGTATTKGPGRLTVEAMPSGDATLITLHASGGAAVRWHARSAASWLTFSSSSGTLFPGESTTIAVSVDSARQPRGRWDARVLIEPGGAEILIHGRGESRRIIRPSVPTRPPTRPTPTRPPEPTPSQPPPAPSPTPPPPTPTPTPSDPGTPPPSPSDPPPSEPPPAPSPGGETPPA
ncbi:hypothetical protein ACFQLX_02335 [Streptomyces polyrhachis]|uniref:BACON domain-containing protein n=1 Tax=Streptomyces polyrhachis TaxID=1282885 RepID=A0ABW2G8E4_9ACTN